MLRPLLAAALLALSLPAAFAQHRAPAPDTSRPIRIIVPWPPGGPVDFVGRTVAQKLSEVLHQPTFVDNVVGASGTIGAGQVSKAVPDGTTLLVNAVTQVITPAILPKVPFDAVRDFTPIGQIDAIPLVLAASPDAPFSNWSGFAAWARQQPQGVSYASAGIGSSNHLAGALLGNLSGLDFRHIPYKGSAPAGIDVTSGLVPIIFAAPVELGRLRPIAIAANHRSPLLPDVPTFAEAGLPGMVFSTWHGLFAPANTPPTVVARLSNALREVTASADFREKLRKAGAEVTFSRPEAFTAFALAEQQRVTDIVHATGAAQ